jgi:hypothetical protein
MAKTDAERQRLARARKAEREAERVTLESRVGVLEQVSRDLEGRLGRLETAGRVGPSGMRPDLAALQARTEAVVKGVSPSRPVGEVLRMPCRHPVNLVQDFGSGPVCGVCGEEVSG